MAKATVRAFAINDEGESVGLRIYQRNARCAMVSIGNRPDSGQKFPLRIRQSPSTSTPQVEALDMTFTRITQNLRSAEAWSAVGGHATQLSEVKVMAHPRLLVIANSGYSIGWYTSGGTQEKIEMVAIWKSARRSLKTEGIVEHKKTTPGWSIGNTNGYAALWSPNGDQFPSSRTPTMGQVRMRSPSISIV